jgi:translation initiation factor 1
MKMGDICNICGLPKDICVCQKMNTEQTKIYVVEKHVKGPMFVTIVNGLDDLNEIENMNKELKKKLACGGTLKNKDIVLQGKHKKKIILYLKEKGYDISHL